MLKLNRQIASLEAMQEKINNKMIAIEDKQYARSSGELTEWEQEQYEELEAEYYAIEEALDILRQYE